MHNVTELLTECRGSSDKCLLRSSRIKQDLFLRSFVPNQVFNDYTVIQVRI